MKKVIYYSEPIGKEKIVLILETYKEEEKPETKRKQIKTKVKESGRNQFVDMTDPYWKWYFGVNKKKGL